MKDNSNYGIPYQYLGQQNQFSEYWMVFHQVKVGGNEWSDQDS